MVAEYVRFGVPVDIDVPFHSCAPCFSVPPMLGSITEAPGADTSMQRLPST